MTTSPPQTPPPPTSRRPDASMSLLVDVMTRTLDPGYADAAARREQDGTQQEAGARGRSVLAVVALLVVGVLLATAWWQARGSRPVGVRERQQLAAEITRQDAEAGRLQRNNAALQASISAERARQLQVAAQGGLADRESDLGLVTGAAAVRGPGIVVTVDDAPSADGSGDNSDLRADDTDDDGRVLDQDLQLVVNGLWDAGAEAVAINGQRLSALSAIRSAGEAILVDYRPLSPPYRIEAVGDPQGLQTRFSDGPGGRDVQSLKDNFGIRVDIASADQLSLPAAAGLDTRRAAPLDSSRPTVPSSGPSSGTSAASGSSTTTPGATDSSTRRHQESP